MGRFKRPLYWADSEGPFKNVAKMIEAYWADPEGPFKNVVKMIEAYWTDLEGRYKNMVALLVYPKGLYKNHGKQSKAHHTNSNGPYKNIKRYHADTDSPFMKSVNTQRVETRRENKKYDSNRIILCNHCHTSKEAPKGFGVVDTMALKKKRIRCNQCYIWKNNSFVVME